MVVVEPAESLNPAAANALLKVLEEPPPEVVFLLVSDAPQRLLPTIKSRCRQFPLTAPQPDVALAWLQARDDVSSVHAYGHSMGSSEVLRLLALDDAIGDTPGGHVRPSG